MILFLMLASFIGGCYVGQHFSPQVDSAKAWLSSTWNSMKSWFSPKQQ